MPEKKDATQDFKGTHCVVPRDTMAQLATLIVSMPYAQVASVAAEMQQCGWVTLSGNEDQLQAKPDPLRGLTKKKAGNKKKGKR